jgi:hypothetical protein
MAKRKKKGTVTRRQVLHAPEFELTRQNNAEFTRVGTANRLFRHALRFMIDTMGDRYISGRMTKILFRVLQSDPHHDRGNRTVIDGQLSILEGFNFNRETSLQNVLHAPYTITHNKNSGEVTIEFASFIAKSMIDPPDDTASGIRLKALAVALNFAEATFPDPPVQTDLLPIDNSVQNMRMQLPVSEKNNLPVFVTLGVEFFTGARGVYEALPKKHNAMAVVKVFPAVKQEQ